MTAVFTRSDASIAARRPAPPAPTITASYVWKVVIALRRSPLARVEREHDERAEDEKGEAEDVEQRVDGEPCAGPTHVVLRDHAEPVDPVEQREDEQRPVPRAPDRARPPRRHEP